MDSQNNSMGGGSSTGTRDSTYDLTAVLYHALQGVENCQTYMGDAEGKQEHRQFFQMAMDSQKQLAEQAKKLLHDALMEETGGSSMGGQQRMGQGQSSPMGQSHSFSEASEDGSAFRFASSETEGGSDQFSQGSGASMDRDSSMSDQQTGGGSSSRF